MSQVKYYDALPERDDKRMSEGLVAYEKKQGVDVNYKRHSIVISNNDNEAVGVLNAYTAFSEIYIDDLWVDAVVRGQGYGRRLVTLLEEQFKGRGFNNINLVTSEFQAPDFYRKCGFIQEFVRINKENPQLTKYFFVKFLNEGSETQGVLSQ
jgi:ribosomal protein S18 acetylase RimI-like enzyme